jgi:predicted dehydrogenase
MRVAIVGCGLIGTRRAAVAAECGDDVKIVVDVDERRARRLAKDVDADAARGWQEAVERDDVDVVVVATVNRDLASVAIAALLAGKDILCEKPLGLNAAEAGKIAATAAASSGIVKVGFNHRHKRALVVAKQMLDRGEIGRPFALRVAYGHGGRPGYEKEWRGDIELAGGGALLDQGVHVVDLARWFLGEVCDVAGVLATAVWDVDSVEDNAFALLRFTSGAVASLHANWTQWRNLFRFELFGDAGHLTVEGLGGSYGPQRLLHVRRSMDGSSPSEQTMTFGGGDDSWREEWLEFGRAVATRTEPLGSGNDGLAAARVIDAVYRSAREGVTIRP